MNLSNVDYLAQETDVYCGPASAVMALQAAGAAGLSQANLYAHSCHNPSSVWSTTPDGLTSTLTNRAIGTRANGFYTRHALPTENSVSRLICWTIFHHQRPAIALVSGDAHWIVVTGYELEAGSLDPISVTDQSYKIAGFYVNDPFSGTFPPEIHGRFEYVSYNSWKRDKLNHAVWDRPDPTNHAFKEKFVTICGPDDPELEPDHGGSGAGFDAGQVRDPRQAIEDAIAGLDQAFFRESDPWQAAREGTSPGRPLLIERLDQPEGISYLVPFQRDDRETPLSVLVSATTGEFEGAAATPTENGFLSEMLDPEQMLARFQDGVTDSETGERVLLDRSELYPALVWRICRESRSIYWPFYRFDVEGAPIFIRIDGEVFFELHDALGD